MTGHAIDLLIAVINLVVASGNLWLWKRNLKRANELKNSTYAREVERMSRSPGTTQLRNQGSKSP